MRMILMAAVMAMAGCPGGGDDGVDPDGSGAPLLCRPAVGPGDAASGTGTPPVGVFDVSWTCTEGCDLSPMLVVTAADRVEIAADGAMRWSVGGARIDGEHTTSTADGCWLNTASADGCRSSFFVCDDGNGPTVSRLTIRDAVTGAEQSWSMH